MAGGNRLGTVGQGRQQGFDVLAGKGSQGEVAPADLVAVLGATVAAIAAW